MRVRVSRAIILTPIEQKKVDSLWFSSLIVGSGFGNFWRKTYKEFPNKWSHRLSPLPSFTTDINFYPTNDAQVWIQTRVVLQLKLLNCILWTLRHFQFIICKTTSNNTSLNTKRTTTCNMISSQSNFTSKKKQTETIFLLEQHPLTSLTFGKGTFSKIIHHVPPS